MLKLAALIAAAAVLTAEAPGVERRTVRVVCGEGPAATCTLSKADLLGMIGASEELQRQLREAQKGAADCPAALEAPGQQNPRRRA